METIDNTLCKFFARAGNLGGVSDSQFTGMTILSLLDEYEDEILQCDPSYSKIINAVRDHYSETDCLFQ